MFFFNPGGKCNWNSGNNSQVNIEKVELLVWMIRKIVLFFSFKAGFFN